MLWDPSAPSEAPFYILVRWFSFSAIVLAIGALLFQRVVGAALRSAVTEATRAAVADATRRLALATGVAVAAAALLRVVMQRAMLNAAFAPEVVSWRDTAAGAFGIGFALQIGGGVLAVVASRRRGALRGPLAALAMAAMAVSPGLSGHAAAGSPVTLSLAADAIHMVTAGAWVGMLALLALAAMPVIRAREPEAIGTATRAMVAAFSPVALGSVALLGTTGIYAAWRLVGSLHALVTTRYGAALLVKLGLLGVMLALGAINWRRLGPGASAAAGASRFRSAALAELTVAVLVLLVTAALVGRPSPVE
jgi:putative copper export protein